jgi:hypothetical protein
MNKKEQIELIKELDEKLIEILESKGEDYASSQDRLGNFKRLSLAARTLGVNVTTPHGYAMFMVLLKIDRINNLLNSDKTPNNESVDDSFSDGINYFKLSYCCYKDKEHGNERSIPSMDKGVREAPRAHYPEEKSPIQQNIRLES